MLEDLFFRLRSVFRRETVESEMEEELRFHSERQLEKYLKTGMSRDEAQRRVRHGLRGPGTGEGRMPRRARRIARGNAGAGSSLRLADAAEIARLCGSGVVHAGAGDRSQHRDLFGGLRRSAAAAALSGCGAPGAAARDHAEGRRCERLLSEFSGLASAEPHVFGNGGGEQRRFQHDRHQSTGEHRRSGGFAELSFDGGCTASDRARLYP